ncbi:MAG: tRNA (N6-isopentenyl adenosine(37)-C2)-methylthiotransferase MiaB [Pyrinomonadaceae bacterium]
MTKTSVYIETLGCQMNMADTERAATRLREAGYDLSDSAGAADVVVFNTCSIRERAAHKVFTRIGEVRKSRRGKEPLIGIMGCVAQLEGAALFDQVPTLRFVAGTTATDRLPVLIERARNGETVFDLGARAEHEAWNILPTERRSPHIALVPIIEGCNKFCSYCIVPFSRGREKSRPADEIIREILFLRGRGFREVQLIGQNVNSYRPASTEGLDSYPGATPFSRLLRAVAATGIERIKFTSSFPRDFHADIVCAMEEHPNLCNWIHLPVQSGSDRILRAMRRGYKVQDYLKRVDRIKSSSRSFALTSDIIVGFPGETAAEFGETLKLIELCQYDGLYIFKYSERSGTPSAKLSDDVSEEEKTARLLVAEVTQRKNQALIYQRYIGSVLEVLVEGTSAKSKNDMAGHSTCHKVVNFPCDAHLVGQIVPVRITAAKSNSLYGERVR